MVDQKSVCLLINLTFGKSLNLPGHSIFLENGIMPSTYTSAYPFKQVLTKTTNFLKVGRLAEITEVPKIAPLAQKLK